MCKGNVYEIAKILETISKVINKKINNSPQDKRFTLPALMILHELRVGHVKTLTEISEELGIPNSTISVIVDRLVKMGIVKRERDETDKRKILIYINDDNSEQECKVSDYYMDNFTSLFKNASTDEINDILRGLKTLEKVISDDSV